MPSHWQVAKKSDDDSSNNVNIPQYQNFLDSILLSEQDDWAEEKAYIKQNGFREDTEWWDTTHNTIYDIANKKVWVTLHEGLLDSTIHKFSL